MLVCYVVSLCMYVRVMYIDVYKHNTKVTVFEKNTRLLSNQNKNKFRFDKIE